MGGGLAAWGVHDDGDADETDQGAGDVVSVGSEPVDHDGPAERAGDEHAAVGGQDAAEVRLGLKGAGEAVGAEGDDAECGVPGGFVFADALSDEPGAADLGERGEGEQQQRADDRHGRYVNTLGPAGGVRLRRCRTPFGLRSRRPGQQAQLPLAHPDWPTAAALRAAAV